MTAAYPIFLVKKRGAYMIKRGLYRLTALLIFLITASVAFACDRACPLPHVSPWDKLAEKSFGLPRGLGVELMTEEEWGEQKTLMSRMTPQDRQEHKNAMHLKLVDKAKEKGMDISFSGKKREFKRAGWAMPFAYHAGKRAARELALTE